MSNSSAAWLSQVHFLSLNIKGNPIFISFTEPQFPHLKHGLGIWKAPFGLIPPVKVRASRA